MKQFTKQLENNSYEAKIKMSHNETVSFIWQVAELLRGHYHPNQYRYVMLPLIVLRRLDCVLESTKEKVLKKLKSLETSKIKNIAPILNKTANQKFHIGNSFTKDQCPQKTFGYILANPPFGVEWKKEQDFVKKEYSEQGFGGRFGAGLPRISDGSLFFLQHMISKMKEAKEGGTRLAIVFNGSPLFTGGAGSGENEIRRWIIEKDLKEIETEIAQMLSKAVN